MRGQFRLPVFTTGSPHSRVARVHPTRTTTKLLLSVACAVSAVSGCMNVTPAPMQPAGAPGTAGTPPRHEPSGQSDPVEVRAPALEALRAGPEQPAQATASATGSGPAVPAAAEPAGSSAGTPPGGVAPPVPDIPEPLPPGSAVSPGQAGQGPRERAEPKARVPREVAERLPVRPEDVCAFGRKHGRWAPDSPEARICGGVEGG
ncbi:hypothetical protein C0216_19930 [Streptomyces globosus]|uniref:Uncharacterized protein n=1 Tax=Streptomyces globosus TaxID=68209 RepID=A0A344U3E5_9ACTN|nr:hypothetical protein C0216_19930 [Streptomyces globosus]